MKNETMLWPADFEEANSRIDERLKEIKEINAQTELLMLALGWGDKHKMN